MNVSEPAGNNAGIPEVAITEVVIYEQRNKDF